jgi:hypothetical protein
MPPVFRGHAGGLNGRLSLHHSVLAKPPHHASGSAISNIGARLAALTGSLPMPIGETPRGRLAVIRPRAWPSLEIGSPLSLRARLRASARRDMPDAAPGRRLGFSS